MNDLNIDDFKFEYNQVIPRKGRALISEPFINDIYFKRSVVIITEHGDEGTIGFVLNKPVSIDLNETLTDFPDNQAKVSLGGPVGTNSLHYLHTFGETVPNSVEIMNGIYWGGDFEHIKQIITEKGYHEGEIRFFLGYSGWSPGQLDDELNENLWVVTDIKPELIMNQFNEEIWRDMLSKMGQSFQVWANSPSNPNMN